MNIENLKRIMSGKKSRLPSVRSQEWKTVYAETDPPPKKTNKKQIINTYLNEKHHRIK